MRFAHRSASLMSTLALALLGSVAAQAQQNSPSNTTPKIGEHVRVQMNDADSSRFTGRLRALYHDSLAIMPDSDHWEVSFTRGDIARLEVEHDEHTRDYAATTMAVIGGLTGGGIAVANCFKDRVACAADYQRAREAECQGDSYVDSGTLLLLGGVLAGGLVGYALAPAPHWDVVMMPTSTTGFDGQQHLGLNLGMRYSLSKRGGRGRAR